MEILRTEYIVDSGPCRVGDAATVAKISSDDDLRELLSNIIETGYYDTAYFERQTGLQTGRLTMNLWFVASLVAALEPERSIELAPIVQEAYLVGDVADVRDLDRPDPPIPSAGHLVWAPGSWWEAHFEAAGLVRAPEIERRLHGIFDPCLAPSNHCFFIHRRVRPALGKLRRRERN